MEGSHLEGLIEKEPNELWVVYLKRVLEDRGMYFGGWINEDTIFTSSGNIASTPDNTDFETVGFSVKISYALHLSLPNECNIANLLHVQEKAVFESINFDNEVEFVFYPHNNDARFFGMPTNELMEKYFGKYEQGCIYDAEEVIKDILSYITDSKPQSGFPKDDETEKPTKNEYIAPQQQTIGQKPQQNVDASITPILDEILRIVKRVDQRSSQHPLALQDEHKYLERLYIGAINEDPDNLQFFEYERQRIPYVLVDSSDIWGNVGKPSRNLYLVARDIATEPWQQQIVAFHESLCIGVGHEEAKRSELPLAKFLGKEKEYLEWRKKIDNDDF